MLVCMCKILTFLYASCNAILSLFGITTHTHTHTCTHTHAHTHTHPYTQGHNKSINALAVDPSTSTIISGSYDGVVNRFTLNTAAAAALREYSNVCMYVYSCMRFISGSYDGVVNRFTLSTAAAAALREYTFVCMYTYVYACMFVC